MYIPSTLTLLATLAIASTAVNAQQACNGFAELCNKPYNTLSYIMTHNSYGFTANPASNQLCPTNVQLDDGVRGLKLSAIKSSNATTAGSAVDSINLCHTSCTLLNAGPAVNTLTTVANWLKNNPNEVITIMWNNLGGFAPEAFEAAYNASGIMDYVYVQTPSNYTWPTLGEMITSGKRVVNFVDEGAMPTTHPWLMREWDYVFETPYDNHNETQFRCTIDRPAEPNSPQEYMYVMNHFLYGTLPIGQTIIEIPQKGTANVTNSEGSLLKLAKTCTQTFGRQPNFLEIDFYNRGNSLQIAAQLNNVTYTKPAQLQCDVYAANAANNPNGGSSSSAETNNNIVISSTILLSLVATTFIAFL
ncbi:unnamed protein product [Mucor hiemalis]